MARRLLPSGGRSKLRSQAEETRHMATAPEFKPIIVGPDNTDPYPEHGEAIRALGAHLKLSLDPARCYPYRR